MSSSGAWGKIIHEKNLKQKSRDIVPLTKVQLASVVIKISSFVQLYG
jgi:hypothetical protein